MNKPKPGDKGWVKHKWIAESETCDECLFCGKRVYVSDGAKIDWEHCEKRAEFLAKSERPAE